MYEADIYTKVQNKEYPYLMVTNRATFIIASLSPNPKELSIFEARLLHRLANHCDEGRPVGGVRLKGITERRAARTLVKRKLAAHVKGRLFPSPEFIDEFHPNLLESPTIDNIVDQYHSRTA